VRPSVDTAPAPGRARRHQPRGVDGNDHGDEQHGQGPGERARPRDQTVLFVFRDRGHDIQHARPSRGSAHYTPGAARRFPFTRAIPPVFSGRAVEGGPLVGALTPDRVVRVLQIAEVAERVRAAAVAREPRHVFGQVLRDLGRAGEVLVLLLP